MQKGRSDKELNIKSITEKLEAMGLTQSKLASELGVSPPGKTLEARKNTETLF